MRKLVWKYLIGIIQIVLRNVADNEKLESVALRVLKIMCEHFYKKMVDINMWEN